jgi:hypothetical protein
MIAILALAGRLQYEKEFEAIQKEWTENGRLRHLLLTSWPPLQTMYPPEWEDSPGLRSATGSIQWENVAEIDHQWKRDQQWGMGKTKALREALTWPVPHDMTSDGSKCIVCFNPFGPEGCYQLGTCKHGFHPCCLIPLMIRRRACPICTAPLHPRLYLTFGLREFMPRGWAYDPREFDQDFQLGDFLEKPLEWVWQLHMSQLEMWYHYEPTDLLKRPKTIMQAADLLYPGKPVDDGIRQYFYQMCGHYYDRRKGQLVPGENPNPVNSQGLPATPSDVLAGLPNWNRVADGSSEMIYEQGYHTKRLQILALEEMLCKILPATKKWLDKKGPRPMPKEPPCRQRLLSSGASTSGTSGATARSATPPGNSRRNSSGTRLNPSQSAPPSRVPTPPIQPSEDPTQPGHGSTASGSGETLQLDDS